MNILFLLKTLEIGGVEVVTTTLANYFADKGHSVAVFAFATIEGTSVRKRLTSDVTVYTQYTLACNHENVQALRHVMKKHNIQIVINQWGLPFFPLKAARKAAVGMDVKFISVYHNTPDMNGRLQGVDNKLETTSNPFIRCVLKLQRRMFEKITGYSMRWNYYHSDRYMVLSPSFVQKFIDYTNVKDSGKLIVQTNPVTIDCSSYEYDAGRKRKEIVFIGRLDFYQKKVNRVIDTWALLEERFPDWKLTIVGDGPDRVNVEAMVKEKALSGVSVEGYQDPMEYYKRASILILTSEFEGFPLVLVEAMSFGVVPTVYGSYSAVYDIIEDGVNGKIVKPVAGKFITENMADSLYGIMWDENRRQDMAQQAIITSKEYSIDKIYTQWMEVLTNEISKY